MGKHNNRIRHKRAYRRQDPTGVSSNLDSNQQPPLPTPNSTPARSGTTGAPIIKKLGSTTPADRAWAAAAISNLALSDSNRLELLKAGVINSLLDALSKETELEGWVDMVGALHNLCSSGGDEVGEEVIRREGVKAVLSFLPKISEGVTRIIQKEKVESKDEQDKLTALFNLAEQVVNVLWSLSEISDAAVKEVTGLKETVVPLLYEFINPENGFSLRLAQAAAQCLNILTESNPPCQQSLASLPHALSTLASIASGSIESYNTWTQNKNLTRILACNIIYNVRSNLPEDEPAWEPSKVFAGLVGGLDSVLFSYDFQALVKEAEKLAGEITPALQEESEVSAALSKSENELRALEAQMGTIQLGLELLTNMYSEETAEEAEAWENDDDDQMEDEEMEQHDDDDDMAEMMQDQSLMETIASESSIANPIEETTTSTTPYTLLTAHSLLSKTLHLCSAASVPLPASPAQIPTLLNPLSEALSTVRLRAFGALNNLLNCAQGGGWFEKAEEVIKVWGFLFEVTHAAASSSGAAVVEILEASVGCMWALARGWDALKQKTYTLPLTLNQIQALTSSTLLPSCTDSLKIKVLGVLGIVGKTQGSPMDLNTHLGSFLISTLQNPKTSAEVLSETLNAVFDIYADASFDYDLPVFVQGGYLQILRGMLGGMKSRVKGVDKRKMKVVRERLEEAVFNLGLFVEYKENEAKSR
ncbi:hypothetical protein HDV05_004658 [Chytridiales sp. JEL 0842]|nr:hypothetical protein HDV05_004658 [Chytridiales sp. JEL 0842]